MSDEKRRQQIKAAGERYNASSGGKLKRRQWRRTEAGKAATARYQKTEKHKDRRRASRTRTYDRAVAVERERRRRNVELIRSLKSAPCADCGNTFDPVCMDFDHRPGETKIAALSKIASLSREAILAEIAKCDVVCSNCHRLRTFRQRNHRAVSLAPKPPAPQLALSLDQSERSND